MGLKGTTVRLHVKNEIGRDDFNAPIYDDNTIEVEDVLIAPVSSTDVISNQQLYGKKAVYNLAIPKGDTHCWTDAEVEFFGERWRTFGFPQEGIDELIPLRWNRKVMVERYG